MSAAGEHWFDRLTARVSRRQALKAGLAGMAALTVPSLTTSSARAENFVIAVDPCFVGCKAFTHQTFRTAKSDCFNTYNGALNTALVSYYVATAGLFGGAASYYVQTAQYHHCLDAAMMHQKVSQFDCSQKGCSNFDPKQPNGPCDTCTANCCVCPSLPLGYICCFFDCADPTNQCCPSS